MDEPLRLEPKAGGHQFVQSMGIDAEGVMWIVGNLADNTCPPMKVFIDVPTETVEDKIEFPTEGAPHDSSFLNDLVILASQGRTRSSTTRATGPAIRIP